MAEAADSLSHKHYRSSKAGVNGNSQKKNRIASMPFFSEAYLNSLSKTEQDELVATRTFLGFHPETQDYYVIPDADRYSGMYVLGVQGVGKSSFLENVIAQD